MSAEVEVVSLLREPQIKDSCSFMDPAVEEDEKKKKKKEDEKKS